MPKKKPIYKMTKSVYQGFLFRSKTEVRFLEFEKNQLHTESILCSDSSTAAGFDKIPPNTAQFVIMQYTTDSADGVIMHVKPFFTIDFNEVVKKTRKSITHLMEHNSELRTSAVRIAHQAQLSVNETNKNLN